jgi:hypothetical protein
MLSAYPPLATKWRTSRIGSFVPKGGTAAHSITLSARNSSDVGTSAPNRFRGLPIHRRYEIWSPARPEGRQFFAARRGQLEICPDFDERRTASASCSHSAAISR